jgi:hypothetical protein
MKRSRGAEGEVLVQFVFKFRDDSTVTPYHCKSSISNTTPTILTFKQPYIKNPLYTHIADPIFTQSGPPNKRQNAPAANTDGGVPKVQVQTNASPPPPPQPLSSSSLPGYPIPHVS